MFESIANWFQGNGFVSNAQLDEDKKKRAQDAALANARASVPFAQYDPNTRKFTNKADIARANQDVRTLELPNITNQVSPVDLIKSQASGGRYNPGAPWESQLQTAVRQKQLIQPFEEPKRTGIENFAVGLGNIPILNVAGRLGAWGVEGLGNLTGNKSLADSGSNFRSLLDLGMSNAQIEALPEEQRNKLRALQTGVEAISPLDLVGVTGLVRSPIVAGVKQATKDAVTGGIRAGLTSETRQLLRQGAAQQGVGAAVGGVVAGAADPAIQAYVNGEVDFGSLPSSIAQGALWGAGIPGVVSPARNVPNSLNSDYFKLLITSSRR